MSSYRKKSARCSWEASIDGIKRGESDAVEVPTRKIIDAVLTMLEEALEAARRADKAALGVCYDVAKTPLQNLQHPYIAGVVGQYLESKFAKQYEDVRTPFLRQRAETEARINALEAEGVRAYA